MPCTASLHACEQVLNQSAHATEQISDHAQPTVPTSVQCSSAMSIVEILVLGAQRECM